MATVIRFMPDDWLDVVLRPLDMISPEANTYAEIVAPDLRFAAVVVLGLVAALCWFRLARPRPWRPFVLLLVLLVATGPWFATTGNGRYFIPFLVVLGPLFVGLLTAIPATLGFRVSAAALVLALQVFLLTEASPWRAWSLGTWREPPYFAVDPPPATPHARYVGLSNISYSLIAPQFPEDARWLNLASGFPTPVERALLHRFLSGPGPLTMVAPSLPSETTADDQPSPRVRLALQQLMADHGLTLRDGACQFLASEGLARVTLRSDTPSQPRARVGFWLCPIAYDPAKVKPLDAPATEVDRVFMAVERLCPRFFRGGEAATLRIADGYVRQYGGSDTKVYVYANGSVTYKFWRSINPVYIGTREQVLAGQVRVDCDNIRAPNWRRGGP